MISKFSKKVLLISCFVLLIVSVDYLDAQGCTYPLGPCCVQGYIFVCARVRNGRDIRDTLVRLMNRNETRVREFHLIFSRLTELPRGLFEGTRFSVLVFRNVTLDSLAPRVLGPSPFQGLNQSLGRLRLIRVTGLPKWDWTEFSVLERLGNIEIRDSEFPRIPASFSSLGNEYVHTVHISGSRVSLIEDDAFSTFTNLNSLTLSDNQMRSISRKILPEHMPQLEEIDLSNNWLESVPTDLFANMKSIYLTDLRNNRLQGIDENVITFDRNFTLILNLEGNPLVCDCGAEWMGCLEDPAEISARKVNIDEVTCVAPPRVRGKIAKQLTEYDFRFC